MSRRHSSKKCKSGPTATPRMPQATLYNMYVTATCPQQNMIADELLARNVVFAGPFVCVNRDSSISLESIVDN